MSDTYLAKLRASAHELRRKARLGHLTREECRELVATTAEIDRVELAAAPLSPAAEFLRGLEGK